MSDLLARIAHANSLVSIYDFLDQLVDDRSRPRKIHCPAHHDVHKSANVYPDTNSLYCFAESMSYDPVGLVALEEGLNIAAACEYIERNAGIRWDRQQADEDEFWRLASKAGVSPDDERHWSRRDVILWRWEVHRSVLQAGVEVDWSEFDDAHLEVRDLRKWRDSQLDTKVDTR